MNSFLSPCEMADFDRSLSTGLFLISLSCWDKFNLPGDFDVLTLVVTIRLTMAWNQMMTPSGKLNRLIAVSVHSAVSTIRFSQTRDSYTIEWLCRNKEHCDSYLFALNRVHIDFVNFGRFAHLRARICLFFSQLKFVAACHFGVILK